MVQLPETSAGYKNILLIIDHFSKWIEIYPMRSQTAEDSAIPPLVKKRGRPKGKHARLSKEVTYTEDDSTPDENIHSHHNYNLRNRNK